MEKPAMKAIRAVESRESKRCRATPAMDQHNADYYLFHAGARADLCKSVESPLTILRSPIRSLFSGRYSRMGRL